MDDVISTDVLIIGGGIAGIMAAIEAHKKGVDVVLITKGPFGQDGAVTWMAGAGYQAPIYPPDSTETHINDAIRAGKSLSNRKLVEQFLKFSPSSLEELQSWGMRLAKKEDRLVQIRLPGHSYDRSVIPAQGMYHGSELRRVLSHQIRRRKEIKVMGDCFITDLLLNDGTIVGVLGIDLKEGDFKTFRAKSTILATGGFMACYEYTTASPTSTGDGHGMAFRAGVKMMDMEFVQFFPTTCLWPPSVYGDMTPYGLLVFLNGIFYNIRGERFMERYYPQEKDFAPREAASRAILREAREGRGSPRGGAYLCFRHLPKNLLNETLSTTIFADFDKALKRAGIDIREDGVEVGPAAHYVQGGCWIDERCRTNLPGLFIAGEVGSGGKDGADRLAGNALPFCWAMGCTAGGEATERAKSMDMPRIDESHSEKLKQEAIAPLKREDGVMAWQIKGKIRKITSEHAIFARTKEGLTAAIREVEKIKEEDLPRLSASSQFKNSNLSWVEALEAKNMVTIAEMVLRAALMREESRGLHERADFPEEDPNWIKHIFIEKVGEKMRFTTEEVPSS